MKKQARDVSNAHDAIIRGRCDGLRKCPVNNEVAMNPISELATIVPDIRLVSPKCFSILVSCDTVYMGRMPTTNANMPRKKLNA